MGLVRFLMNDKRLLLVLLFSFVLFFPFTNAGYNLDEPTYLQMAENVRSNPLDPFSGYLYQPCGKIQIFGFMTNGPFVPYYIAFVQSVFGENERLLHLSYYPFVALAIVSIYVLGDVFAGSGFLSAAFFSVMPAFVNQFGTIMTDLPFVAFFLASLAFFVRGVSDRREQLLLASGIAASFAILTKYIGLLLIPLLLLYLLLERKFRFGYYKYLTIPVCIFLLWNVHNLLVYGKMSFLQPFYTIAGGYGVVGNVNSAGIVYSGFGNFIDKLLISVVAAVTWAVFPLFLLAVYLERKRELVFIAFAAALALALSGALGRILPSKHLFSFTTVLFVIGLYILFKVFLEGAVSLHDKRTFFCYVWMTSMIFVVLIVFPNYAYRYYLNVFAPFSLLIVKRAIRKNMGPLAIFLAFLSTLALAIFYNYPIYAWTSESRETAAVLKTEYPANGTWFSAGWGEGYYLAKAGFKELCGIPSKGDRIIRSTSTGAPLRGFSFHLEREIVLKHYVVEPVKYQIFRVD